MNCNNYEKAMAKIERDSKCIPQCACYLGVTGPTGPAGTSETITIGTTTTGEPGTDAAVIDITGGPNHVLNFVIPRGFDGSDTSNNDFCCYCTEQMTNILEQITTLYPNNQLYITLDGGDLTVGTIGNINLGPSGTSGVVEILDPLGVYTQLVSICSIDSIRINNATYNDTITYLPLPDPLPTGCCADCDAAFRSRLPIGTANANIITNTQIQSQGNVIRNEYGVIVLNNPNDNTITFISTCRIDLVLLSNPAV